MNQFFVYGKAFAGFLFAAFLIWLYWPVQQSFFNNDDWVIIFHNRDIPLLESWRYFSMKTVWFYRPLQSLQYGLTYKLASFEPFLYNIQLLIMHLVLCLLGGILLKRLFNQAIAILSVILFSVSCISPDILCWKANYNTLQNALVSVAACVAYLQYLDKGHRRALIITVLLAALNCLTKESAVNLPFILFSVWLTRFLQNKWANNEQVAMPHRLSVKQAIWPLASVALVGMAYVGLHRFYFENIEERYSITYKFVDPLTALVQWKNLINTSIFGSILYGVAIEFPSAMAPYIGKYIQQGVLWPFVLALAGVLFKKPILIFAVGFSAALQIPVFALETYYSNRYFYLSSICGMALISAGLVKGYRMRNVAKIGLRKLVWTFAFYASLVVYLLTLAGNIVAFQKQAGENAEASFIMNRLFRWLEVNAKSVPDNSFFVLRNLPKGRLLAGMGAAEMFRMATGKDQVNATDEDSVLRRWDMYNWVGKYDNKYVIDLTAPVLAPAPLDMDEITTQGLSADEAQKAPRHFPQ